MQYSDQSKYELSLIIPFLNEEENIPNLVKLLNQFFSERAYSTEVIFVDDGSSDQSVSILKKTLLSRKSFSSKIVQFSKNYGAHAAVRAGITIASGDKIIFLSSDMQDPIILIDQMFKLCDEGNDIVWAARKNFGTSFFNQVFSKTYAVLMKKFAISTFPSKGFDVVMFNKKVQLKLNENIENNSSIFLQILSLGFNQATVEYNKNKREKGVSKWTLTKKIKMLIDSFVAFSYAPIRLVSIIGIAFFFFGMVWTIYIIARTILYADLEPGWPALMAILMLGFGVTNIGLGIIAEYLWRTLDASRKRPAFIINEILEFKNEPTLTTIK